MKRLTILDRLPPQLLTAAASDLHTFLPGPTLIHLPGRRPQPLFVSALLHGNEDVGLRAIQQLLSIHAGREFPRALSILIGNVEAARHNLRHLDDQPDFNRVWPSPDPSADRAVAQFAAQVTEEMRARDVFASIDLHNNTGHNPYYACVTELHHSHLHLATLFSRTVVFFRVPHGVQTMAFAPLCPSVTCECGRVGDAGGVAQAAEFLDAALHLAALPEHPVRTGDIHLFHTVATLKVPPEVTLSFDGSSADLRFRSDFDWFNFRELASGTPLAKVRAQGLVPLNAFDDQGRNVTEVHLESIDGELRLRQSLMPSMLTLDERVIRQDCLGYLMSRLPLPT